MPLRKALPFIEGKALLDVGSAGQRVSYHHRGWPFERMREAAGSIVGLDVEPCPDPDVFQGNIEDFDFHRKFEVITMFNVIEHLDNVGLALINLNRHLADGGKLIVTTPNMTSLTAFLDTLVYGRNTNNRTHTHYYDEQTITYMLSRYGFEVVRLEYLTAKFSGLKRLVNTLSLPLQHFRKAYRPTMLVIAEKVKDLS